MKRWISPLFATALLLGATGVMAQGMSPPSFTDLDLNGDGAIDADEFAKHQAARMSERHGKASGKGQGKGQGQGHGMGQGIPAYGDIDLDGDDFISAEEFSAHVAERHGKAMTQE